MLYYIYNILNNSPIKSRLTSSSQSSLLLLESGFSMGLLLVEESVELSLVALAVAALSLVAESVALSESAGLLSTSLSL